MSSIKNTADLIQCDTNNIIHGVKVITYGKQGEETSSTWIDGVKLHQHKYDSRKKKYVSIDSLNQQHSPFVNK